MKEREREIEMYVGWVHGVSFFRRLEAIWGRFEMVIKNSICPESLSPAVLGEENRGEGDGGGPERSCDDL